MRKKPQSITNNLYPFSLLTIVIIIWQISLTLGLIDEFILPAPLSVIKAFGRDFKLILHHGSHTLTVGFFGLIISVILGYVAAISMDKFNYVRKALYPILVLSQTIPYIAIAPLLVLWFGYNATPKIILVTLTCFFPLAIGVYDGIQNIQREYIDEFNVMGGRYIQGIIYVKFPLSLPGFFSALKIASTYSLVGAVISEWIGGTTGLGVYMTRVRRSYEFDKMFAVIMMIVIISLGLIGLVKFIERKVLENV